MYLYVAITKKKSSFYEAKRGKAIKAENGLITRHRKYIAKNDMDCTFLLLCLINKCNPYRKTQYILHIALDGFKMGSRWVQHRLWMLYMAYRQVQNTSKKMVWIAHCSCYVLSTSAKYIVKTNIFCILLYIICLHSIKKNQIYPPHKENLA